MSLTIDLEIRAALSTFAISRPSIKEWQSASPEDIIEISPPNWNPQQHASHNSPMAMAHAALEYLRESGDEQFLFLRTLLESY